MFQRPTPIAAHEVAADRAMPEGANTARPVGTPIADPAPATRQLYAGEWAGFVAWCRTQRRAALPASSETLAAFLLAAAPGLSRGALGRRRAAIGAMHRQAGLPVPQLDAVSRRALRAAAKPLPATTSPPTAAPAILVRFAVRCPRDLAGLRDRALLLLVAATARRPRRGTGADASSAEPANGDPASTGHAAVPRVLLLTLDAEDVRFTAAGVALQLRTRTDDPAPTRTLALARAADPTVCPVRALEDWLRSSDTSFGPVFRKVDRWGNVEHAPLGPDAWHRILARRGVTARSRTRPAGPG